MAIKVKSNLQENFIDLASLDSKLARSVQERAFGKGIALAAGFDLGAAIPLDARVVAQNLAERDAHVDNNRAYEGMQVYVIDEKTNYQLVNGEWIETGVSKAQLAEINAAIEAVRTDLTKALNTEKLRIDAAEGDIDSLEVRMEAVESEADSLDSRLDVVEGDISTINESITAINQDIEGVKSNVSDNAAAIESVSNEVTAVKGRVSALEEAKTTSDSKISTLESGLASEIARATGEEARIEGLVTAEANRAKVEEAKIREDFAAADLVLSTSLSEQIKEVADDLAADKLELQGNIDAVSAVAEKNKTDIAKVVEDLAKEVSDRTAADSAQDIVIAKKAEKTYVDEELAKKAEKVHTHVMSDITDLGTVAGLDAGNDAGQVPVLDEYGKLNMNVIPKVAINQTDVVEDIDSALALEHKSGDIVIINIQSEQVKTITTKYSADQINIANGYQVLEGNVLNDEYAAYLAQGITTFICVNPDAEKFEDRYRPLNSIADTMTRGEIEKELAKKDSIESVNSKIQGAKDYTDNQVEAAKTELSGAISSAKTELEQSIETLDKKVDGVEARVAVNEGEITAIKQAATDLKSTVDTHVDDNVKHITAEERQSWNEKTDKKTFLIGDNLEANFELVHNLGSEDVVVSVRETLTKEMIFTDVKVKDENTVVISFAKAPTVNEFKVVVVG